MPELKAKKFRATLERMRSSLGWVIIRVPFDVAKAWGKRGQARVRVEVNGAEFRSTLFPTRNGTHFMIVNKTMQKSAAVKPGMTVEFLMQQDTEKRTVTLPAELGRALRQDRSLQKFFTQLNYSTRNDICRWVSEPKSVESRTRRAEQISERLMETMEAEIELPPLIRTALARNPLAHDGWHLMTSLQRRSHLFGIFYYRKPEGRARRLQKALDAAVHLMEKKKAC